MRHKNFFLAFSIILTAACSPSTKLIWNEGPRNPETGRPEHTFYVCNPPEGDKWSLWGAIYNAHVKVDTAASTAMLKCYNGSYFRIYPKKYNTSDTLVIKYTDEPFYKYSWAPEGWVIDYGGKGNGQAIKVDCNFLPPYEESGFAFNRTNLQLTDMIPALKKVELAGDGLVPSTQAVDIEYVDSKVNGWYKIVYGEDGIKVQVSGEEGRRYAAQTIANIAENAAYAPVPRFIIEDWPDMQYRGLMLDVARAFLSKEDIKLFIRAMARYKLNYLQFHLTDDEGWRLEIPGLPELTSYGAFHSLPKKNKAGIFEDGNHLCPSYDGCIWPDEVSSNTNGFYTRKDFIEILQFANEYGVKVIPEIDTPGHCRACISAMEYRFKKKGDDEYRLIDPDDLTTGQSLQMFHTNVINVALPQTYKFVEKVIDEVSLMYEEAGLKLDEIHLGGDEVAEGAWLGSPRCREIGEPLGWTKSAQYKEYYLCKVMDILEARGIKLDGWQEIALNLSPEAAERLRRNAGFLNAWSTLGENVDVPYMLANEGYPTLICNVESTYLDLAYNASKSERGLWWGGFVDERTTFMLLPYNNYCSHRVGLDWVNENLADAGKGKASLNDPSMLRGVQAHLWGENIRGMESAGYMVFPKSLGIFERGWNAHPEWEMSTKGDDPRFLMDLDHFCTIIVEREFPFYDRIGMPYRDKLGK